MGSSGTRFLHDWKDCGFISDRSASWSERYGFADGFGLTLALVAC